VQLVALVDALAERYPAEPHELVPPSSGDVDVEVTGVVHDTRSVARGSVFCCVPGAKVDGHDLAPDAVARGAVVLLAERAVDLDVPQIRVAHVRDAMGPTAAAFWGHPSEALAVVGVTGTSGKTTTTHLLGAIADACGRPAEVIGTLTGPRTTPEAPELQAALAAARDAGRTTVAMEVSSHALSLGRVLGTRFAVAVFTNLSHDHLDFHRDLEDYFEAKARLFRPDLAARAVVNGDDPYGARLAADPLVPTEVYRLADATDLEVGPQRCRFRWRGADVQLPLGGRFNVANALAAATAATHLELEPEAIAAGLSSAPPVPGRFEPVDEGQPFAVIVDYAHKPGALESALAAAREAAAGGRVVLVFGAGGERDASKRPEMGEVATRAADRVVLTSDNPRGEDPLAIIDAVRRGMQRIDGLTVEPDRAAAIALALDDAQPGDVVVIAGKGHEAVQIVGDRTIPFDDRDVARSVLRTLREAGGW
jgi:UDP-N-acetylmuramoyl-L-alanyl-D-glutamate--2,6-diaminopimelate ligase